MYQEVEEWLEQTAYKDKATKVKELAKTIRDIPDFDDVWDDSLELERNLDEKILELAKLILFLRQAEKYE